MTARSMEHARLSYWTDADGRIVKVDGPWESWLGDDGTVPDRCSQQSVLGENLSSFIEGEGVQWVYSKLHQKVLENGRTVQFHYRCDSSWLRREMRMTMRSEDGGVRYDSEVLRETRRDNPVPKTTPGAMTLVAMCSFCKDYRFPVESKKWNSMELLFLEADLPAAFSITHGVCDPCADNWIREIEGDATA